MKGEMKGEKNGLFRREKKRHVHVDLFATITIPNCFPIPTHHTKPNFFRGHGCDGGREKENPFSLLVEKKNELSKSTKKKKNRDRKRQQGKRKKTTENGKREKAKMNILSKY